MTTPQTTITQQQSKTLVVTPIPCPSEDYDAPHTTVASLASLRAMAESYDEIMDSLLNTTSNRLDQLKNIEKRAAHCRTLVEWMKKIGDYGGAVTVEAPSSYERAIAGGAHEKKINSDDSMVEDTTKDLQQTLSSITSTAISAIDQARIVSNAAVLNALRNDSLKDDGMAKPSDLWLDRASGFDEHRACRNAERANSVPLLGRVYYRYRGDYYTMDDDEANAAAKAKREKKEQQQQQQQGGGPHIRRMESNDIHKTTFSGATSRQQAASGSTPYLCEVLHDAYGMGMIPPAGGEFYPEPTDVGELLVFNSSRKTYGGSLLSLGVGKEAALKKAAAKKAKKQEEVDLIDLSDSPRNQHHDAKNAMNGSNGGEKDDDDDDKILSSDFAHPRSKMFQVPSYRPDLAVLPTNAGKLELPTDLPLTDVAKVVGDETDGKNDEHQVEDHLDTAPPKNHDAKKVGRRDGKAIGSAGEFV